MTSVARKAYDYIIIGGGSGGSAGARRASQHGAKTLLIENGPSGGTCINYGCRPKIVTWNFASFAEAFHDAKEYGYSPSDNIPFDYRSFKVKRDAYVKSESKKFETNWRNDHVEFVRGTVAFQGPNEVEIDYEDGTGKFRVTAPKICIAAGGFPIVPNKVPGANFGITHQTFFNLEELPQKIAIIGAGYIATEFAGILNAIGTEVHLYIRGNTLLRNFDPMIQEVITKRYENAGVHIHKGSKDVIKVENISGLGEKKRLRIFVNGGSIEVGELLWAIGRAGQTADLKLDRIGVQLNKTGQIVTDECQNTNVPGIYAVGDVTGRKELQPVALMAGRQLANRLFGGAEHKDSRVVYENIPTVVFAHPEIGTIGLTEPQAHEKFGTENVKTYHSKVATMRSVILTPETKAKHPAEFKIVCEGPDEKIVGLHMIGFGTSEILQGFAIAVNMGATKKDFSRSLPIHPTTAEALAGDHVVGEDVTEVQYAALIRT